MEYVPPINGNLADPDRPYINANPGASIEGSIPPAEAIEHPMREILKVIVEAGLTPDGEDLTQLWQAIVALAAGGGGGGGTDLEPGDIILWGKNTARAGVLECNGAAVSRTTYAALFAEIGTVFGAGDGSTTFNLPDLRGEFPRGWDHGRGVDTSRTFASWQADELKAHAHQQRYFANTAGGPLNGPAGSNNAQNPVPYGPTTENTGGTETRPRNVALMFCIVY